MGAVVRAAVLGLVLAGCGTNATVTRKRGDEVQGKLLGRHAGHLWVQSTGDRKVAVPEEDVADVTHPGTPAMVVGGGTLVLSALLFVWADCPGQAPHCCQLIDRRSCSAAPSPVAEGCD